ncbi:mediator of RNA polymerase II transcription subunit 8-like isoform X2 [Argonauta hians]
MIVTTSGELSIFLPPQTEVISVSMQREEKQLEAALETITQRISDLKNCIHSFLMKIEHEYTSMSWPNALDNFALLSGQLNSLTRLLKSEKIPPLKNYVLLPLALSPDKDTELEKLTEGRLMIFNHEVVPVYLRTKPEPEVEEKFNELTCRLGPGGHDAAQGKGIKSENMMVEDATVTRKQLNSLNKITSNIIDIINSAREEWENEANQKSAQPQTSSMADTNTLIQAITAGKGLKPPARRTETTHQNNINNTQPSAQKQPAATTATKAPSTIKTSIKAGPSGTHPYQRN